MAHLALNFPAGRGTSNGRSPIWPSGRTVYNGRQDVNGIAARKRKLQTGEAAIGGAGDDVVFTMQRHLIAVQERIPGKERRGDASDTSQDIDIYVTDCANGFGKRGETQAQLNERIASAFIVSGQILNEGQREAIALQTAGLNTICNSGPYNIKIGQYVCVSAPNPDAPQPYPPRDDLPPNKVLWWVVPFDEERSIGSVQTAYDLLVEKPKVMNEASVKQYQALYPASAQFAAGLGNSLHAIALSAIWAAHEAGIVTVNTRDSWTTNAAKARKLEEVERERRIQELARECLVVDGGLLNLNRDADDLDVERHTVPDKSDMNASISFEKYLFKTIFACEGAYRLFVPSGFDRNGIRTFSDPIARIIVQRQQSAVMDLVATIRESDVAAKRRIIGKALSPAQPGQDFDIHMGNNLM